MKKFLTDEQSIDLYAMLQDAGFEPLMRILDNLVEEQGVRVLRSPLSSAGEDARNELLLNKAKYEGAKQLRTDLGLWLKEFKSKSDGKKD